MVDTSIRTGQGNSTATERLQVRWSPTRYEVSGNGELKKIVAAKATAEEVRDGE